MAASLYAELKRRKVVRVALANAVAACVVLQAADLVIDRLVAELLSVRAGQEGRRLSVLTSASLPALQAYLAGKEAYRGGQFADAAAHFRRAVDIDSTFALAGLDLLIAGIGPDVGHPDVFDHALRAFERSVAVDSVYAPALYHAIRFARVTEIPPRCDAWPACTSTAMHPNPAISATVGWRAAHALRDGVRAYPRDRRTGSREPARRGAARAAASDRRADGPLSARAGCISHG